MHTNEPKSNMCIISLYSSITVDIKKFKNRQELTAGQCKGNKSMSFISKIKFFRLNKLFLI